MAKADLAELEADLKKRLLDSPGAFRDMFSNKKTHIIQISTAKIITQAKKEMWAREGYRTAQEMIKGLNANAGPYGSNTGEGRKIYKELSTIIETNVPTMVAGILKGIGGLTGPAPANTKVTFHKPAGRTAFTFAFSSTTGSDIFSKFKGIKANAQNTLILKINYWNDKYSRRGQEFEGDLNRKIGTKTGNKGNKVASKHIRSQGGVGERPSPGKPRAKLGVEWEDTKSNDPFLDVGHMEGSSVAGQRAMAAYELINKFEGQESGVSQRLLSNLQDRIQISMESVSHHAGEMSKDLDCTIEASSLNKATASEAKQEITDLDKELAAAFVELGEEIKGWDNYESSDSFATMVEKKVIEGFAKPVRKGKRKNVKLVTRLDTKRQRDKKTKFKDKGTRVKTTRIKQAAYLAPKIAKEIRKTSKVATAKSGPSQAPLFLLGILNEQLPQTVEANMGAPALTNRTGRFAGSPRVTDVVSTPEGFPSFGYTYQRDPYGKFEDDNDYDPRRLIDRSMREIAAEYAIGRFYTRRV